MSATKAARSLLHSLTVLLVRLSLVLLRMREKSNMRGKIRWKKRKIISPSLLACADCRRIIRWRWWWLHISFTDEEKPFLPFLLSHSAPKRAEKHSLRNTRMKQAKDSHSKTDQCLHCSSCCYLCSFCWWSESKSLSGFSPRRRRRKGDSPIWFPYESSHSLIVCFSNIDKGNRRFNKLLLSRCREISEIQQTNSGEEIE